MRIMRSLKKIPRGKALPLCVLLVVFALGADTAALAINPGDILVADQDAFGGGVIGVDPVTGVQTIVSFGGYFVEPVNIAVGPGGEMFVMDQLALGGAVIQVDPRNGDQSVFSSGGNLFQATGIAIDLNGDILIANWTGGAVIRINRVTKARTIVSSGGYLQRPSGVAVTRTGEIFVADQLARAVIRIDPVTFDQTLVSSGENFRDPRNIAIGPNGEIIVVDSSFPNPDNIGGPGAVIQVDPETGDQTILCSDDSLVRAFGLGVAPDGNIFVADSAGHKVIHCDPEHHTQTPVSLDGYFHTPVGLAIYSGSLVPVANAGPDQAVRAGDTVVLDGSASFDDNTATAALLYQWTITGAPIGSGAVLTGANTQSPSFLADVPGTYRDRVSGDRRRRSSQHSGRSAHQ